MVKEKITFKVCDVLKGAYTLYGKIQCGTDIIFVYSQEQAVRLLAFYAQDPSIFISEKDYKELITEIKKSGMPKFFTVEAEKTQKKVNELGLEVSARSQRLKETVSLFLNPGWTSGSPQAIN